MPGVGEGSGVSSCASMRACTRGMPGPRPHTCTQAGHLTVGVDAAVKLPGARGQALGNGWVQRVEQAACLQEWRRVVSRASTTGEPKNHLPPSPATP